MKKLISLCILLAAMVACAGEKTPTVAETVNVKPTTEQLAKAKAVNNSICPVTGSKIGSMGKPVQVIYKGYIVNLCCMGCPGDFAKDPEKYLQAAQAEMAPGKAVKAPASQPDGHHQH